MRGIGPAALFHFELVGPGHQGTPEQEVEQHDQRDQGRETKQDRPGVARIGRRLQVGAQTRELEGAAAQRELLGGHQEEPAARPAHHAIPDQADHRGRHLQDEKAPPGAHARDGRDLLQIGGERACRVVVAEGHVPGLAGKNEDDAGEFQADIRVRKQCDQREGDRGQEREDGNALQDIQQRDHDALRPAVVGSNMPVDQGKHQREQVGQQHTQQRVPGIGGQHRR